MGRPGFGVDWQFPMLIAAIDPAAEARLDGLNHALVSGQYLPETYPGVYGGVDYRPGGPFPVLASSDSGVDEYAVTQVQQLAAPAAPPVLNRATMSRDLARPGRTVLGTTITAQQAYQYLLGAGCADKLGRLWSTPCRPTGPSARCTTGAATAQTWSRPRCATRTRSGGCPARASSTRPWTTTDTQYRTLRAACARQQQHASGADHDRDVQHGEDPGLRSAVAGPARAVSADRRGAGRRGQPPRAGRRRPAAQPEPRRPTSASRCT